MDWQAHDDPKLNKSITVLPQIHTHKISQVQSSIPVSYLPDSNDLVTKLINGYITKI
jgi:hypothetical protein